MEQVWNVRRREKYLFPEIQKIKTYTKKKGGRGDYRGDRGITT